MDNQRAQQPHNHQASYHGLLWFVLLSTLIHGCISWIVEIDSPTLFSLPGEFEVLMLDTLSLETSLPAQPTITPNNPPTQPLIQRMENSPPTLSKRSLTSSTSTPQESPEQIPPLPPTPIGSERINNGPPPPLMPIPGTLHLTQQQISERATIKIVSAHINKRLEDHFFYPSLASKKRLQGEVHLRFIITTSGNIKQITIEQSSGYESLDQAAYQALAEVEQINLSQLVSEPWDKDMPLELPVIYRLK